MRIKWTDLVSHIKDGNRGTTTTTTKTQKRL